MVLPEGLRDEQLEIFPQKLCPSCEQPVSLGYSQWYLNVLAEQNAVTGDITCSFCGTVFQYDPAADIIETISPKIIKN